MDAVCLPRLDCDIDSPFATTTWGATAPAHMRTAPGILSAPDPVTLLRRLKTGSCNTWNSHDTWIAVGLGVLMRHSVWRLHAQL